MKTPLLAVLALFGASLTAAQDQGVTVSAYTGWALAASPEARSAEDAFQAADASYKAQWANMMLPTLSFTGTAYPYGHNPANSYRFQTWRLNRDEMSFNTTANWNLFNSFQDYQRLRSARFTQEAAQRAALQVKQDRAFLAIQAYYDLQSRNELLEVARQNLRGQEEQYKQSLDLYRNGMRSLADLLKSETDFRSSELRLVAAESEQKNALVAFNLLVERQPLQPVTLAAELDPGTTTLPVIGEDLDRALAQRPDAARARKDLEAARVAFQESIQGLLPTIKADLTWNKTDTAVFGGAVVPTAAPNPNYYLGLSLSLPVGFNGVSQALAASRARALQRQAQSAVAQAERTVRQDVAGAFIGLERAVRSYSFAILKESIAQRALEIVGNQYKQGSLDAIRMNQAQNDYLDSRVQKAAALRDIFIERARYKRAVGDPLW